MNNEQLIEKMISLQMRNIQVLDEGVVGKEVLRFIKDSGFIILKIRGLKDNQELFLDLIDPVGFISIVKEEDNYVLTIVIKGQKSKSYTVDKSIDVYKKILSVVKDQLTTGVKDFKLKYEIK